MRALTLYIFAGGLLAAGTGFGAGQIELRKHRFFRHEDKGFERLVLEFKNNSGQALPSVRVGTDGAAGEVTIQVGDVSIRGEIPESEINDRFVPRSRVMGPISVTIDNARGNFTLRTFLKEPQARIDAFWLDSPTRLVIDAYGRSGSRNNASLKKSPKRDGSGAHAGKVVCFPSTASVGMQVTFQATGKKIDSIAVPVENGRPGEEGSVVCYPKSTQLSASLSFDRNAAADLKTVKNSRVTPAAVEEETPDPVQAVPAVPAPRQEMPIVKVVPKTMKLPTPSAPLLGAPANNLLNKSPLTLDPPKSLLLSLPSPGAPAAAPGLLSLPSPETAPKPAAPILGLSLPAPGSRTPSADASKGAMNLPLTLPSLPQPSSTGLPALGAPSAAPALKLSLPPPQSAQQLLPPLSTK